MIFHFRNAISLKISFSAEMHYFQIIKVWHELTQGLWLAEGLMIKTLPEDVEDLGSNLVCLIQTRNLNPTVSHIPSKYFSFWTGKPAHPLSRDIYLYRIEQHQ